MAASVQTSQPNSVIQISRRKCSCCAERSSRPPLSGSRYPDLPDNSVPRTAILFLWFHCVYVHIHYIVKILHLGRSKGVLKTHYVLVARSVDGGARDDLHFRVGLAYAFCHTRKDVSE